MRPATSSLLRLLQPYVPFTPQIWRSARSLFGLASLLPATLPGRPHSASPALDRPLINTTPARSPTGTLRVNSFLSSTSFYLAAGTVTIDPVARKVLILQDLETKAYQLPRGRKDWSEPLAGTAVRETFEETGFCPRLLPVPLSTRATAPGAAIGDASHPCHAAVRSARFHDRGCLLVPGSARLSEEPVALMQHYQPDGVLAVVLWYVGVADSRTKRQLGTQMADEECEPLWVGYDEAVRLIVDKAYSRVVRCALELVEWVVEEDGSQSVMASLYPGYKIDEAFER